MYIFSVKSDIFFAKNTTKQDVSVEPIHNHFIRGDFYDPVDRSHLNTDNLMFLSNDDKLLTPDPDIDHLLHNP